jgi:3-hydroxyacyl-[acyl-carrier-protein] dehydratase
VDKEILERIPQRPPFLFVDKIVERGENHIWVQKTLDGTEDFFKGHFPGHPIMPGVLLLEAAFQGGALLMGGQEDGKIGVVTRVDKVKFRGLVKPQKTLDIKVEKTESLANAVFFKGRIYVKDKCVLSLTFSCALVQQ